MNRGRRGRIPQSYSCTAQAMKGDGRRPIWRTSRREQALSRSPTINAASANRPAIELRENVVDPKNVLQILRADRTVGIDRKRLLRQVACRCGAFVRRVCRRRPDRSLAYTVARRHARCRRCTLARGLGDHTIHLAPSKPGGWPHLPPGFPDVVRAFVSSISQ